MAKDAKGKQYKDTLNLPKTDFDMRAKLLTKEPIRLAQWAEEDIYSQVRAARRGAPRYILHDGPPYANGDIHMGHLLNKVLKDIVVRYKTMTGFDAPYIPGWDCHGLPIEAKVMAGLGKTAGEMDRKFIRRKCKAYAEKFVDRQSRQFQRLAVWGDYDKPYITMDPAYEAAVLEVFARVVAQGIVYRQLKPVHWSIENQTALADAELEYHDREDTSIYVLLECCEPARLRSELFGLDGEGPLAMMIWTTTPWTLPANLAVAVHPDFEYAAVRYTDGAGAEKVAVVAAERIEAVFAAAGEAVGPPEVLATVTGRKLAEAGVTYCHPLLADKPCPVVQADYVTLEDGTGGVHTAPGHGLEDYGTALKYDLEIYCPVGADGTFDDTAPEFLRGEVVWDANGLVCERLRAEGAMFHQERFTHSYPHDWRSKQPTIFRATEQWFIAVDKPLAATDRTLRDMAMAVAAHDSDTRFIPEWGRNRMAGMLQSRPDWCISRQRSWGLPIPAFVNEGGEVLMTPASIRTVAEYFAAHGSDSWFDHTPAEILGEYDPTADPDLGQAGEAFAVEKLTKQMDIFDVWFESGSSWFAVAIARGLVDEVPVDLYLEGSDQHRGWFQLSLLPSLAAAGVCPFAAVLTHGFVVDEAGYKMAKSSRNVVSLLEELDKRGADIMRLWVASVNYQDDIKTSDALIAPIEEAYRKIRNTLRFAMGNCFDFDPAVDAVEPSEHAIDRWMRLELHRLTAETLAAYEAFEFHKAYRLIYEFCTVQTSSIYMAAVKDRLYCEAPRSARRRATQAVLHEMLMTLTPLLAPILPFTCEEVWEHIPNRPADQPASVHLALMPTADEEAVKAYNLRPELRDEGTFTADRLREGPGRIWERLLAIRDEALVKLEAIRNAGVKNSLDTEIVFRVAAEDDAHRQLLDLYLPELEDMLGVGYARVEVGSPAEGERLTIEVLDTRDTYARCGRSWKRRPDVGSDPDYPDLSARDAAALKGRA